MLVADGSDSYDARVDSLCGRMKKLLAGGRFIQSQQQLEISSIRAECHRVSPKV